ncbi:dicarboxylate/amino acid:cation symporter [Paenibacillus melissococcoides]|uniref:Dicarboxylate/amino acid:cation symporter n=1 Tax=Paenibacillus melissococcoides TaxID=2912268 RepID=A0ABN8U9W3_9BACL|nr:MULTISPECIES: dicarboxylate/amino acid:cation symporter [Paenibacillus]MEB9893901.1 dicarboxylate/amino acid:cation symporter [Bacillus cereus]CAH8247952.1 dicarboxylate/amino acid:cation symporter [Paenibacillus melissococcoides]CAH8719052.1 dicarboxylate/amino acid:cation symporter [Paenibacillus melissococcoides]CAH8720060.1 dicarboxylate/amino acid:cation symporter [Paenibacillus melissococcoides]GIO80868.1 sodium:proton antiporter [Paenibacillus dendritiformis]
MRLGLFPRIVIAIVLGIGAGLIMPDWFIRIFATLNHVFGQFLSFLIPLIILGFIVPGIGELGRGAGKLLGLTAFIVYISTVLSGMLAYGVASSSFSWLLSGASGLAAKNPEETLLTTYFELPMPPVFDIMTALLLSFLIGVGITFVKTNALLTASLEFKDIVAKAIQAIIIPLLPFHIAGLFMNMTQAGEVAFILQVFVKVFAVILVMHFVVILCQYAIAGAVNKRNPLAMLRTMLPAYLTALGTQSSAATIPVTMQQVKKLGTDEEVTNFVVPLCATIHITGSAVTITSVASAILYIHGVPLTVSTMVPFIFMLGIAMIAAPSVPGGGVMAAIGLFQSMLGFDEAMVSLAIALYIAQDSFGTAANVTGDGAIAQIIHAMKKRVRQEPSAN